MDRIRAMQESLERRVRRLQRHVRRAALLGRIVHTTSLALAIAGAGILLSRLLLDLTRVQAAWALLVVVPAVAIAWIVSRRSRVARDDAATWLDVHAGASGTLVTGMEVDDPRWRDRLTSELDRAEGLPRMRARRMLLAPFPAVAFVALTLWIDVTRPTAAVLPELHDAAIERVREKLETLEETVDLDEELVEDLRDRLARLDEEADPAHPESTFEALDRLEERLAQEAERLEEAADRADESMRDADLAAATDDLASDVARSESLRDAMEETLADLTEAGFSKDLPEALQERLGTPSLQLGEGLSIDPDAFDVLSDELRKMLQERLAALRAKGLLREARLADAAELRKLREFRFSEHACDEKCMKGGT